MIKIKQQYKNFEIEIFDDPNYISNSANNSIQYDKVYSEEHQEDVIFPSSRHGIIVKEFGTKISSCFILEFGWTGKIHEKSFILENDKIWIIAGNKIYCLEIPSLELIWNKEFDASTNISISKLENDFIIHGELEIFRITKEGEIAWSYGGRDIWINIEGKPEITIDNNNIRLFDFESNEYVIDFNGNQIEDNPRVIPKKDKKKWWRIFD